MDHPSEGRGKEPGHGGERQCGLGRVHTPCGSDDTGGLVLEVLN